MKQEVGNFLRNFKLGNELVNIFRNASIGTTVTAIHILVLHVYFIFITSLVFMNCLSQPS
jgi:hypothetical protein